MEFYKTTIIDGNQSGTVVTFNSGEDTTACLTGFTILNGDGGGIRIANHEIIYSSGGGQSYPTSIKLEDLHIRDNLDTGLRF